MLYNQPTLIKNKSFLAFLAAQFTAVFHDNLFKNALVVFMLFNVSMFSVDDPKLMVTYAAGIFILPFLLFSSFGAMLAEQFNKTRLIQYLKLIEIGLAFVGGLALIYQSLSLSFFTLFLLGSHAAVFAPSKYSLLPEMLPEEQLIKGNALLNSGTFLAILVGTITGTTFSAIPNIGVMLVVGLIIVSTVLGWISSWSIPVIANKRPSQKLTFNIFSHTKDTVTYLFKKPKSIILPVLGVSWFYFLGGMFLSQIPNYTKEVLGADSYVLTFFLTLFSIGIAGGGLINNILLKTRIEATYVPLAALGITIFSVDLFFASPTLLTVGADLQTLQSFLKNISNWRIVIDLFMISVMCGLFVVPLVALIQHRTTQEERPRIIAGSSIMDALFIVVSSLISALLIVMGCNINELFLAFSIANLFVALYICSLIPDYLFKSIFQILFKLLYKIEIKGLENIEKAGPRAIIIGNHTSFLDAPILAAFLPGKPIFAINTEIAKTFWIKPFLKLVDTFAIDPTNPYALKSLVTQAKQDRHVVIFPEGRLTTTGALMKIYEGPGVIAEKADAMILPVRIDGVQHTPFARLKGKVPSRLFPKITITILEPYQHQISEDITGRERRQLIGMQLYDMMEKMLFITDDYQQTLYNGLLMAADQNGRSSVILEDIERKAVTFKQLIQRSTLLGRKMLNATQAGDNVGVLLPNGTGVVTVFFSLQAIGRVAAMLNFTAGLNAVTSACQTANIKVIYTSKRFIELAKLEELIKHLENFTQIIYLEDLKQEITFLDKMSTLLTFPKKFHNRHKVSPDLPAVILFTSGSEGTPKGVVLSHKNLLSNMVQLSCRVDFNQQDIIFNALPLFHSFGLSGGMLLPVLNGVKTFLYPSPLHYRIVPEVIYSINATIMFGTDTFLKGYARMAHAYDFYRMRYIFAGAEKVQEETRRLYMDRFGVRILEGYGTTETSPVISVNSPLFARTGTVGRLLTGIQYRLEPVPGVPEGGRLFVKGPNVMMGYYLSSHPGIIQPTTGGEHDTGDIVNIDHEGFFRILGRAKRFAKIAGEMVSLSAAESMIQAVWADTSHAIVSLPDEQKGEKLILVTTHKDPQRSELVQHAKNNGISPLSIPGTLLTVDKLPVLGTGKTDYVTLLEYVRQIL